MAGILIIENLHTIPFWIWFKDGVVEHVSVLYYYCITVRSPSLVCEGGADMWLLY